MFRQQNISINVISSDFVILTTANWLSAIYAGLQLAPKVLIAKQKHTTRLNFSLSHFFLDQANIARCHYSRVSDCLKGTPKMSPD